MSEPEKRHLDLPSLIERMFRSTSGVEGEDFQKQLVKNLAESLEVQSAFVGELEPTRNDVIRLHAIWGHGQLQSETPFEHTLTNSPCEKVIREGFTYYGEKVQEHFPNDPVLEEYNAQSYVGIPLIRNEMEVGLLAFLDDKPFADEEGARALLMLLADRVVLELERARREEELRVSEQKFRHFANLMPLVVYEMDTNGYLNYTNNHGLKLSGMSEEDFLNGVHVFDLFDIDQQALVQTNIQSLLSNKATGPNDYTFRRRDGVERRIRVISEPVISEGIVVGLRGVVLDLSSEAQLEELQKTLENAQNQAENAEKQLDSAILAANSLKSTIEKLHSHTSQQPDLNALVRSALDTLTMLLQELSEKPKE